ncbi:MAG: PP2C family protein-serine/threonine phosphatase, partial [Planctomycetota bacterium]
SILLLDEKCDELFIAAARGIDEEEAREVRIPVGQGISGKVLNSRVPRLVDDVELLPQDLLAGYEKYATRSFISVPLVVDRRSKGSDGRAIGVINMTDKESEEEFTSGDLKLLTALANQAAVLIENFRLIDIEKELRIARRIQRSLLPVAPPDVSGIDIDGSCVPAHNVGGDYFDFVHREDEGLIAAVIADVSGHDIASALMMAVVRSSLRGEIRRSSDPAAVLREVNGALYEDLTRAELFLSVFCCLYDVNSGRLRFANAGHGPGLLYRPGESSTRLLDAEGLLVGVLDDVPFAESEVQLEPGDVVLLHTDGIVEASDASGAMFGMERLSAALERSAHFHADEILERIFEEVYSFGGKGVQSDDMTAVVLKVTQAGRR